MVTDTAESPVTTAVDEPNGGGSPRGSAARRFQISGEVIARTVAELPDREREAINWIAGYCVSKNISHREVAPQLMKRGGEPYSTDSLYQALTGKREPGQLLPLVEAIENFRKLQEENTVRLDTEFVENSITRRIFAYCDKARRRQRIGLIYGESQIGKSTGLSVYKERNNHGETLYVRMSTRASLTVFMQDLALVLNLPTTLKVAMMRRAILNCFDARRLLIVDEAHEGSVAALNFAREIHDRRKCGVVFSGTNVLRQTLTAGANAKNFSQLLLRGLPPLLLPSKLNDRDMALFAAAYDLGPAPTEEIGARVTYVDDAGRERKKVVTSAPATLQAQVIDRAGLGRWCMILQEARDIAEEQRRPITWGSVIAAWHSFEHLSQGEEGEAS